MYYNSRTWPPYYETQKKVNQYCVYSITNKKDKKIYIGITKQGTIRYKQHCKMATDGGGYYLHQKMREEGIYNFYFTIIEDNISEHTAKIYEEELIKELDSTNPEFGYNVLPSSYISKWRKTATIQQQSQAASKAATTRKITGPSLKLKKRCRNRYGNCRKRIGKI